MRRMSRLRDPPGSKRTFSRDSALFKLPAFRRLGARHACNHSELTPERARLLVAPRISTGILPNVAPLVDELLSESINPPAASPAGRRSLSAPESEFRSMSRFRSRFRSAFASESASRSIQRSPALSAIRQVLLLRGPRAMASVSRRTLRSERRSLFQRFGAPAP